MAQLNEKLNILICQKSKIKDWIEHFKTYYPQYIVLDGTKGKIDSIKNNTIIVINYDLIFRRPEYLKLKDFTLMLDESSMIQNDTAKKTKFITKMQFKNLILLSGTPTSGKYENLYSQIKMLGWKITKTQYWNTFINYAMLDFGGFPFKKVTGYKNVDLLKAKLREYGAVFMKTEEVITLPEITHIKVMSKTTTDYERFLKNNYIEIDGRELAGDTTLTKMLYARQLCGQYNKNKIERLVDMIESTEDRLIIFYNFNEELNIIKDKIKNRPTSIVNGSIKDLSNYEKYDNSVTLIQYQAGSMGLNLQKANKIIYFTLPLSSELFEQSKKRTHRMGQTNKCFYYYLMCKSSIEEKIFETLRKRRDYTNKLFEEDFKNGTGKKLRE